MENQFIDEPGVLWSRLDLNTLKQFSKDLDTLLSIDTTHEKGAKLYLLALAYSDWQYHIDDSPDDIMWGVDPPTDEQIAGLQRQIDNVWNVLGYHKAWDVYPLVSDKYDDAELIHHVKNAEKVKVDEDSADRIIDRIL